MRQALSIWFLLIFVISCIFGVMYVVMQQNMRTEANDPQIQMAEDTARRLETHSQLLFTQKTINIAESLAPFIMTFDKNGVAKSSEAVLHDQTPVVPTGVFMYAKNNGENRLTWQPENGVRIAAVVVPYANGFVLVGRNIREVEKREDQLLHEIIVGWLGTVFIGGVVSLLLAKGKK